MSFFEIFMIGIGLSMDAFAAAVCKGFSIGRVKAGDVLTVGFFFGGFQAVMPIAGYFLGKQLEEYIISIDHWVAMALLSFIGLKMIVDKTSDAKSSVNVKDTFFMAIATSIDALAVGVTMAFLKVNIFVAAVLIGTTTFVLSSAGVITGNKLGSACGEKATAFGGIILIGIGLKILLEHLGFI